MGGFAAILGAMPSSKIVAGVLCPLLLLGVGLAALGVTRRQRG